MLDPSILDTRLDENGTSYAQAARAAGFVADSAQVGSPCQSDFVTTPVWAVLLIRDVSFACSLL